MASFETRIRHLKFTLSPFSAEQMSNIGSIVLNDAILPRIRSGINLTDGPAKPLTVKYAAAKAAGRRVANSGGRKFSGQPIRNLTLRGWTLASAKVKSASEDRVTIGFITPQANQIITSNNRIEPMWGVSPNDEKVMHEAVRNSLRSAYGKGFVLVRRTA